MIVFVTKRTDEAFSGSLEKLIGLFKKSDGIALQLRGFYLVYCISYLVTIGSLFISWGCLDEFEGKSFSSLEAIKESFDNFNVV
jgi:hypothetical protein